MAAIPTTQPVKAAVSIVPSMPMLTTPDRSQTTPHRAPNADRRRGPEDDRRARREDVDEVADELEDDPEDGDAVEELVHQFDGTDSLPYERVIVCASAPGTSCAPRPRSARASTGSATSDDEDHRLEDVDQLTRRLRLDLHLARPRRAWPRTGCAAGMIATGLERASRATAIASKPTVVGEARLGQVGDAEQLVRAGHPGQARPTSSSSG